MDDGSGCVLLEEEPPAGSYGWIQWKGTSVCMDVHCTCGAHMHIDTDYNGYSVQCPHCGQVYEVEGYVKLIPQNGKCRWHDPILMEPDCAICSSSPCEHTIAWSNAGRPQPIGQPWPGGELASTVR